MPLQLTDWRKSASRSSIGGLPTYVKVDSSRLRRFPLVIRRKLPKQVCFGDLRPQRESMARYLYVDYFRGAFVQAQSRHC